MKKLKIVQVIPVVAIVLAVAAAAAVVGEKVSPTVGTAEVYSIHSTSFTTQVHNSTNTVIIISCLHVKFVTNG